MLLKRLDGCKLEQVEASRHRGRSGRMMLWTVGRLDSMTRRLDSMTRCPDGWQGTKFFDL
jgi:hypothetical protein